MRTADCACRESFGSFCSFGSAAASYDAAALPDAAVYITPFSCMIPDRCICPISGHSPAASPSCPARHSPARIRLIQPRCCVFSFFILMPPLSPVPSSYPIPQNPSHILASAYAFCYDTISASGNTAFPNKMIQTRQKGLNA